VTGHRDDAVPPGEQPSDEYPGDFPRHDREPLADALAWAQVLGLRAFAVPGRRVVRVRCPGCGADLGVPAEPWRPRVTARRVRTFAARHHRHVRRGAP
jgi:hypothetical protein